MTLFPVSASPARIAALIGAAPRQRGRSDACRLTAKRSPSSTCDSFCPKAITTHASALHPCSCLTTSAPFTDAGRISGTAGAWVAAQSEIGVGVSLPPRPAGRSGCDTIPTRSWARPRCLRVGRPKAPEPKKRTLMSESTARLLLKVAFQFAERRAVLDPVDLGHPVDDQHAVEVVDLVLPAAREQPGPRLRELAPLQIGRGDGDLLRPQHLAADVRQ